MGGVNKIKTEEALQEYMNVLKNTEATEAQIEEKLQQYLASMDVMREEAPEQNDLEGALREYINLINDPKATEDQIKEQNEKLKNMMGVQYNGTPLESLHQYVHILNTPSKTDADIAKQKELLEGFVDIYSKDQMVNAMSHSKEIGQKGKMEMLNAQLSSQLQELGEGFEKNEKSIQKEKGKIKEQEKKKEREREEAEEEEQEIAISAQEDEDDASNDQEDSRNDDDKRTKDLEEEKAKVVATMAAIENEKQRLVIERTRDHSVRNERTRVEAAQDALNYMMACYIVEKTIEAERREMIAINLQKTIQGLQTGKTSIQQVDSLQAELKSCNERMNSKDAMFANQFAFLQAEVVCAKRDLSIAKLDLTDKVQADMDNGRGMLRSLRRYDEDGIMQREVNEVTLSRNHENPVTVIRQVDYDAADLIANGPNEVNEARYMINGKEVRVLSAEYGDEMTDTSYHLGTEQVARNDIGETGTTSTTSREGDLVEDNPTMEDVNRALGKESGNVNDNFNDVKAQIQPEDKEEERENGESEEIDEDVGEIPYTPYSEADSDDSGDSASYTW